MTRAVLDDISIDGESVSGRLLIVLPADSAVSYNDQLFVQGKLKAPEAFETQTGHTFDYPNYLRAQGIRAHMSYAKLLDTKPSGFSMLGMLFSLKHAFEYSLDMLFPNPDNALLQGVLLGEKRGISQDITNAFIQSGLVHIVVLSGYNLSIVAEAVFRTLSFLPRAASFGVGGALMVFFALMTGAGAATVRALVMAIIALLARYLRRPHMALRALVVAASVMIVWNPLALLYDSSFILSVLATFGLITLSPWVEQLLIRKLPEFVLRSLGEQVRSIVATTLAVEIFVVPALLYFSGVLSLLSLPANALVLPIIPAAMLFGFLAGLLGLLHPLLGLLPAFIADVLLKWILLVAAVIASIPLSSVTLSQFSPWFLILAYIPLTWFAVKKYQFTVASSLRER
jgi:competence protein ComEC